MTAENELRFLLNGHQFTPAGATPFARCEREEPVFVLCGRDPVAAEVIRDWADRREILQHHDRGSFPHGSPAWEREGEKIAEARLHATEMAAWHEAHIRGPVR